MALAKRIIPCLDVTAGRVVKGVNFLELRDAGDPVEIARRYDDQGADELTFLDITATSDQRDLILPIIEPNQRTPILKGHVENPTGWLLSNQSVTATINMPAPPGEVIIPTGALVDEGGESIVFVQPDPAQNAFALRRVKVVR